MVNSQYSSTASMQGILRQGIRLFLGSQPPHTNNMPKVFKIGENGFKSDDSLVNIAIDALQKGHIIGIPTDTIYGLAVLAQHNKAVMDLYKVKNRDCQKPIAICVADVSDVSKWAKVSVSTDLVKELLPGPVTLVFERMPALNGSLNPNTNLAGIRIPNDQFIRAICRQCGEPLALTSANISSHSSSLVITEFREIWPNLKIIFDGGHLGHRDPERLGSTVVDLSVEGFYHVIRNGCAFEETVQILEKHNLKKL